MPECEAEERILQALYEMENSWGAGVFDYAKIRRILTGDACSKHLEKAA
jgi:hypothetical protein